MNLQQLHRLQNNYGSQKFNFPLLVSKISPSIDYFTIFIPNYLYSQYQVKQAVNIFCNNLKIISRNNGSLAYSFDMPTTDGLKSGFLVGLKKSGYYLGSSLHIRHPGMDAANIIHQAVGTGYSLSRVEYTLDISCQFPALTFDFLRNISRLKWAGGEFPNIYETTFYANNVRTSSSKGFRMYIKDVDGSRLVRMEMVLKRRYLNSNGVHYLPTALDMNPRDVFEKISFSNFDFLKFYKKYRKMFGLNQPWAKLPSLSRDFHAQNIKGILQNISRELQRHGVAGAASTCRKHLGRSCLTPSSFESEFKRNISNLKFA